MRYMGIDYGSKRIGIAVSDDEGRMAFPFGIIVNRRKIIIKEIIGRIKKENIGVVVVGLPLGLHAQETAQTRTTKSFISILAKAIHIPIETENEMFTSRMAEESGMRNSHIDASSAALILQSYLDRMHR